MEQLKAEVEQLKEELDLKKRVIDELKTDLEISEDSISSFEEELKNLNDLINSAGMKRAYGKKIQLKLVETEKELRELKNNMGLLRKEKIQLQQQLQLQKQKGPNAMGHIIEIKEEEVPVHNLVKDLTNKLNKQRLLITRLKNELSERPSKEEIKLLKPSKGDLGKEFTQLKLKLENKETELNDLKEKFEKKEEEIKELKLTINDTRIEPKKGMETGPLSILVKELQDKLNESKIKNSKLQKKLEEQLQSPKKDNKFQNQVSKLESELKQKEEELDKLLKQNKNLEAKIKTVDSSKVEKVLTAKTNEITNLTKELYLNKNKIVELQSQLNAIEQKNSSLQNEYIKLQEHLKAPKIDIQEGNIDKEQELRIRELRTIIETLKKQIKQQRVEINYLRNK